MGCLLTLQARQCRCGPCVDAFLAGFFFAGIAAWFPGMKLPMICPRCAAEVALSGIDRAGFQRDNSRDRLLAAAFTVHFIVRLTISSAFPARNGFQTSSPLAGGNGSTPPWGSLSFGTVTLAILVPDWFATELRSSAWPGSWRQAARCGRYSSRKDAGDTSIEIHPFMSHTEKWEEISADFSIARWWGAHRHWRRKRQRNTTAMTVSMLVGASMRWLK